MPPPPRLVRPISKTDDDIFVDGKLDDEIEQNFLLTPNTVKEKEDIWNRLNPDYEKQQQERKGAPKSRGLQKRRGTSLVMWMWICIWM